MGRGRADGEEARRAWIRARAAAEGLGAPLTVRTSRNTRRMSLRVNAPEGEVVLVLPPGVAAAKGLLFLLEKRDWIATRRATLPARVPFAEGTLVPLFGVPHRILRETDPAAPAVAIGGGEIRVRADPRHLPRRVKDHLVALAKQELGARARVLALKIGRRPAKVGVRDTKSRWGSCSAKGGLSFCWRLILAPERVIDGVVAHEVAHLVEMNHGPRFRRLLQSLMPESADSRSAGGSCARTSAAELRASDPKETRGWLARHKDELFCYG
jgi:predicted metal-dependent hydrolase